MHSSITVTEDEFEIWLNDLQYSKAHFPIEVTEDGIVICASDKQK